MTAPPSPPIVAHELPVPTPDGVPLATRVARPAGKTPVPTILLRTYLGRDAHRAEAEGWARHGFACAVQDVRGRFDSSGTFDPYAHEGIDGHAAVDRLVAQPWCDGRVIAVGGSYGAFCALAIATHPAVVAVISAVPAMRPVHAVGGVPPLLAHLHWWLLHGHARTPRTDAARDLLADAPRRLAAWPLDALRASLPIDLPDAFRHLAAGPDAPSPIDDETLAGLDVPILHVGGWYDVFLANTLDLWHTVGRAVTPRPTRGLLIGPWTHELRTHEPARYGERDHGPTSRCPLGSHQVRWLRAVLDGADAPPPVRVFELGADRWLDGSTWPPKATQATRWFASDDTLVAQPPAASTTQGFTDDPSQPFPSRWTPIDERRLPDRTDRAVFETAPFDAPRRFVGEPEVTLWAESDQAHVDWFVRLLEVTAEGRVLVLTHGALDAGREPVAPGPTPSARPLTIPLGARCVRLEAGHRLRLEITGSFHPSYPRRSDGVDRFVGALRPSRRRVLCGGDTPTTLDWATIEEDTP